VTSRRPRAARRVLVTGAAGFVGSHLTTRLVEAGDVVHGVVRPGTAGGSWPGAEAHAVDLADAAAVQRLVHDVRPEWVFHLAGRVTGDRRLDAAGSLVLDNLAPAVHVATAVAREGCARLVVAGSMEEPGRGEPATAAPGSPYALAKWAGSGVARLYHALYGVPVVIARLSMVYGPGQKDTTKLIPLVITSLLRGESPPLSSGRRAVDWIHVDDVVRGLEAAAVAPGVEGQTVELGSGRLVTIREVVDRLFAIVGTAGAPRWGALADRALERPVAADVEGSRRLIGWSPEVELEGGLAGTVDWYRRVPGGGVIPAPSDSPGRA
jgi:nucleoside-diphosphate-sugar epimerase